MKRHPEGRPDVGELIYTASEDRCAFCLRWLPIFQVSSRRVQQLDGQLTVKRRDKRCTPDCCGPRPTFCAPKDIRVVLPRRVYGLDITLTVGERHLADGVALAQITRDLRAQGIPIDQRHTCRIFRDFLALTQLARGDDAAQRARFRGQGGIVLMCDGVQHDNRSPVLYLVWDAISGEPLFGERKQFRSEQDLIPLLERVRAMDVPVIGAVSDKEAALVRAIDHVFPGIAHQYCQTHFLRNCAKPLEDEYKELGDSVRRRAEEVRKIIKTVHVADVAKTGTANTVRPELPTPASSEFTEQQLARQVGELVRDNSRVSGKAPLDPPELKRHQRLEQVRALVCDASKKKSKQGEQTIWPLLTALCEALTSTPHEIKLADRVERHTDILRGLAHELSSAPDREDRPQTGKQARARVEAYLDRLSFDLARDGEHTPTANFVDGLVIRYDRYREHLFHCFDDPRIPATTNSLEGFFGASKRATRQTLGCGSTTNSIVTNLGDDALLAYHYIQCPNRRKALAELPVGPEEFDAVRSKISENEKPATKRRSRVRNFGRHLEQLRREWSEVDSG